MATRVECRAESHYRLVMHPTDEPFDSYPSPRTPKGKVWARFVLGAIAVFMVWFLFVRPTTIELSPTEQEQLLTLAREQLVATVAGEGFIEVYLPELSDRVLRDGAAFVSLTVDGTLRGCMIDQFESHEPLVSNVLRNMQLAARSDKRFAPITGDEIERVRIKVSVVYGLDPLRFRTSEELVDQLSPYLDGVILRSDGELATYLPSVWETYPDPAEFLSQLCVKAGWNADRWRIQPYPDVQTYSVFEFGEL